MTICFGVGQCGRFSLKSAGAISLLLAGLAIGGCSADVTRFDSTSFSLNDPPDSQPVPSEPVRTSSLNDNQVVGSQSPGPYGAGASSVQVAALPDTGYQSQPQSYGQPSYSAPAYSPPPASAPPPYQEKAFSHTRYEVPAGGRSVSAPPSRIMQGEQIEVHPGDTLYSLSQRYQVSLSEMMSLNSLTNPSVHPGQKLYLPSNARAPSPSNIAAARAVEPARPAPAPLAQPAPEVADRYGATYTVKPGEFPLRNCALARRQVCRAAASQRHHRSASREAWRGAEDPRSRSTAIRLGQRRSRRRASPTPRRPPSCRRSRQRNRDRIFPITVSP